jgi:hypothetical protein
MADPKKAAEQLFRECLKEQITVDHAAYYAAYWVWSEILNHIPLEDARRIFLGFGNGPPKKWLKKEAGRDLLKMFDMMAATEGTNVQQFARMIATEQPQTTLMSHDKHIRRLLKKREVRRAKARKVKSPQAKARRR